MEINYREDVRNVIDALMLDMPGVKGGNSFGFPAYKVNGKVFAFVGGNGIGLKFGEARVAEVIADHAGASPFEPVEGTVWKAWVSIDREEAEAFRDDEALLIEAMNLVAGA